MRIAFIGHAYHQKTGSSQFLIRLLRGFAEVEEWYAEPGADLARQWGATFDEYRYDAVVVWQLHEAFDLLSGQHPNVVFVPMYDAMFWGHDFYWKLAFNQAKILCFSWALRHEAMKRGAVTGGFQYYPDPADFPVVTDFDTLRAFMWYRRRDVSPNVAFRLCGSTPFERFVIHDAPDPGEESQVAWEPPPTVGRVEVTGWSEDKSAYKSALRAANVFFVPRLREGIGMSLLEAMASGLCVVAPDAATMNEYISNGTTGFLFSQNRHVDLDFSQAREIGRRARGSVERGFERWQASLPALRDFIVTPTIKVRHTKPVRIESPPGAGPVVELKAPKLTVVTVCRNAEDVLEATFESVFSQVGYDFDYVVVDGQSTDGTVDIIRRHADRISAWRSAPDDGPYDAMNKSLDLVRGEWVLFMNAGDTFFDETALQRLFAKMPAKTDVVFGHHLYRQANGVEEVHHAADFDTTWVRLKKGQAWGDWLAGIPCHQATAMRRTLLTELRFDPRYIIAADHDVLFRAKAADARFFNADEVVAVYVAGGFSSKRIERLVEEWEEIARKHSNTFGAARFYTFINLSRVSEQLTAAEKLALAEVDRREPYESEAWLKGRVQALEASVFRHRATIESFRAELNEKARLPEISPDFVETAPKLDADVVNGRSIDDVWAAKLARVQRR